MSPEFEIPDRGRNDDFWYNFGFDALKIEIESYSVDESEPGTRGLEEGRLDIGGLDWTTLRLSGTITIPEGLGDYVFEDGVSPGRVGSLIVRAQCMETHYRGVVDEIAAPTNGSHSITIELDRETVAKRVTLDPVLVRDPEPGFEPTETYRYGQTPGLKLADGNQFVVVVDESESSDGSFLPIQLNSFGEGREEEYYELEQGTPDEPTLYINSDVDNLARALRSRAPYGPKRWTKETLENLIGVPVWTELILWTASDVSEGEPRYPWQESVLEVLAESMYVEHSPEEVAEDLEERIGDPSRIPYLLEEIREASQEIVAARSDLENLLEEIY